MSRPLRFGIVVSRFNAEITSALRASCRGTLLAAGVRARDIRELEVPGGWEIPWAAHELARSGRCDAVICLGCVLQGQTPQNAHIARAVFAELARLALATRVPVALGIITPRSWRQALARTRGGLDRGKEAAEAALEMAQLRAAGGR